VRKVLIFWKVKFKIYSKIYSLNDEKPSEKAGVEFVQCVLHRIKVFYLLFWILPSSFRVFLVNLEQKFSLRESNNYNRVSHYLNLFPIEANTIAARMEGVLSFDLEVVKETSSTKYHLDTMHFRTEFRGTQMQSSEASSIVALSVYN
jgi:hypothetical protein